MTTATHAATCPSCQRGVLRAQPITEKRRIKFGVLWVLVSLLSIGLAVLVWLVMPRRNVVTGYVNTCDVCGYMLA